MKKANSSLFYINQLMSMIFAMLLLSSVAHAASFDCGKAVSEVEKIICSDGELSKLDDSLDKAYQEALKRTDIKDQIIESQRQWLKNVRNPCRNAECIKKAYETRIKELGLSSYGLVFLSPSDQEGPPSKASPETSKSQASEPPDKAVQAKIGQKNELRDFRTSHVSQRPGAVEYISPKEVYDSTFGKNEAADYLTVWNKDANKMCFEITTVSNEYRTCTLDGEASILHKDLYAYKKGNCQIFFKFSGDKIEVKIVTPDDSDSCVPSDFNADNGVCGMNTSIDSAIYTKHKRYP